MEQCPQLKDIEPDLLIRVQAAYLRQMPGQAKQLLEAGRGSTAAEGHASKVDILPKENRQAPPSAPKSTVCKAAIWPTHLSCPKGRQVVAFGNHAENMLLDCPVVMSLHVSSHTGSLNASRRQTYLQ